MLIEKSIKENDVITIKLTSGEELMCRLVEERDDYFKVSKPLVVGMTNNGPALMPFLFTVHPDKDVKIHKPVTIVELSDEEFAKQYIKSTTNIAIV